MKKPTIFYFRVALMLNISIRQLWPFRENTIFQEIQYNGDLLQ